MRVVVVVVDVRRINAVTIAVIAVDSIKSQRKTEAQAIMIFLFPDQSISIDQFNSTTPSSNFDILKLLFYKRSKCKALRHCRG